MKASWVLQIHSIYHIFDPSFDILLLKTNLYREVNLSDSLPDCHGVPEPRAAM